MLARVRTPREVVHDRRTADMPINSIVGEVQIKDPYGDQAIVTRQLRDDPLGRLHARSQIDEAQFQAGRAYQRDWETAERGPRAIDPTKEAVDGGLMAEAITDPQRKAAKRLNNALAELGADGASITHDVLVTGMTMEQVAHRRGWTGKSWVEYFGKRFRECLDSLAVVYGFAQRRRRP